MLVDTIMTSKGMTIKRNHYCMFIINDDLKLNIVKREMKSYIVDEFDKMQQVFHQVYSKPLIIGKA